MTPMKPMEPPDSSWWPQGLSNPSSSGSQNGVKYAYFADQCRLVLEQGGKYETGEHRIAGVGQAQGSHGGRSLRLTKKKGSVELASLKEVR